MAKSMFEVAGPGFDSLATVNFAVHRRGLTQYIFMIILNK